MYGKQKLYAQTNRMMSVKSGMFCWTVTLILWMSGVSGQTGYDASSFSVNIGKFIFMLTYSKRDYLKCFFKVFYDYLKCFFLKYFTQRAKVDNLSSSQIEIYRSAYTSAFQHINLSGCKKCSVSCWYNRCQIFFLM